MADELDQELNKPNRSEERIKELSNDKESLAKERDAERQAKQKAEESAAAAQKELEIANSFASEVAKNPALMSHRDEVLSKVKQGYSMEDAATVVLSKATVTTETVNPAGGSATTVVPSSSDKGPGEMTQQERRQALMENESALIDILSPKAPR